MTAGLRAGAAGLGAVGAEGPGDAGKQKAPETFRSPGLMWEWAFATRSFPLTHAWAPSLLRAVCFPTPLSAAGGISVSWRDRPDRLRPGFLSEASAPGSDAPCRGPRAGRGADTPAKVVASAP